MEFPRVLKKLHEEFPAIIKNNVEFPEEIKKVEFPGVLVLGLKIFKGSDNKICWSSTSEKKKILGREGVLNGSNPYSGIGQLFKSEPSNLKNDFLGNFS